MSPLKSRILVVDDDASVRIALGRVLRARGYEPLEAAGVAQAEERLALDPPDVVLIDQRLPDGDGLALLRSLRERCPTAAAIVLTGHGTIDMAVRAIKEGAEQFLTKPLDTEALLLVIERLLLDRRNRVRQIATSRLQPGRAPSNPFLGTSAAIRHLADDARQTLDTDRPVLLLGETGSGKGVLARWIHERGPRCDGAYVDLNCAGISPDLLDSELYGHEPGAFTGAGKVKPGLLEVAHRGTLFLDEVGDLSAPIQARLLKVLEEKRVRRLGGLHDRAVDIRLLTATHQDVRALIDAGRFRSDLYFRISTIVLRLPPLRERPEDVPALAAALSAEFAADLGRPAPSLSPAAAERLCSHAWPGNVRELRNVLERAMLRGVAERLEADHLHFDSDPVDVACARRASSAGAQEPPSDLSLAEVERRHIQRVLAAHGGHVERAARALGVSTSSLYQRLRRYHIEHPSWTRKAPEAPAAETVSP